MKAWDLNELTKDFGPDPPSTRLKLKRKSSTAPLPDSGLACSTSRPRTPLDVITLSSNRTSAMNSWAAPGGGPRASPASVGASGQACQAPSTGDEFWDDGIDDDLLIQASQVAETRVSQEQESGQPFHNENDVAELTKMLENDDDWDMDAPDVPEGTKSFKDLPRTVFQQQNPILTQHPEILALPSSSMARKNLSVANKLTDTKNPVAELQRLRRENEKLVTDKYSKLGEISFLKTKKEEIEKKLVEERDERRKLELLQTETAQQLEATKKREFEALQTEKDFLNQELAQLQASLRKMDAPGSQITPTNEFAFNKLPIVPENGTSGPTFTKRKKTFIPGGLDASFADDSHDNSAQIRAGSPAKRCKLTSESVSVQTDNIQNVRKAQIRPRHGQHTLMGQIARLNDSEPTVSLINRETDFLGLLFNGAPDCHQVNECLQILGQSCLEIQSSIFHGNETPASQLMRNMKNNLLAFKCILDHTASHVGLNHIDIIGLIIAVARPLIMIFMKNPDELANVFDTMSSVIGSYLRVMDPDIILEKFQDICGLFELWMKAFKPEGPPKLGHKVITAILSSLTESLKYRYLEEAVCSRSSGENLCLLPGLMTRIRAIVNQNPRLNDDQFLDLVQHFMAWMSAALTLAQEWHVPWVGSKSLADPSKNCQKCRANVNITITCIAVRIIEKCLRYQDTSSPHPKLYSTARHVIIGLHQVWYWDPKFSESLDGQASLQRHYIWMTKQLPKVKLSLNFGRDGDKIVRDLSELMVESGVTVSKMEH